MSDKRWITIVSLVIVLFLAFGITNKGSTTKDEPVTKTNYIMGTIMNLSIYDSVDDSMFENAFNNIRDIENKMSLNIKDSEINNVNEFAFKKSVKVSPETAFVLKKSADYSKLSDGNFDVTIGPIVKLWGIGTEDARVPNEDEIKSALSKVDYKSVNLDENQVRLSKEGMILDLGGIAKGYAADEVAKYLKSQNVDRAIIDLGGNIYALGRKAKNTDWSVGIQNPFNETRGDFLGVVGVSDKSVVTSGVYERYFEADGKKYHHILSPFTGYPVENELMSVSIISEKSIDGDALSTSAFALGLNEGYKLIESLKDVDAIFVTRDKDVFITNGLTDSFQLKNNDFKVKNFK